MRPFNEKNMVSSLKRSGEYELSRRITGTPAAYQSHIGTKIKSNAEDIVKKIKTDN